MRGDTSDRLAGAQLSEPTPDDLAVRAGRTRTLVDVQRLIADLRTVSGLTDAALRCVSGYADPADPAEVVLPVGRADWGLALRVRPRDAEAVDRLRPALVQVAAAAERALARPCAPLEPGRFDEQAPLYQALVRRGRTVVVVVDPAAGWAALSDDFEGVLGYHRQRPPVALLDLVHPRDRPAAVDTFLAACAGNEPTEPFDLRVRTASGRWRTLEVAVRSFVAEPTVKVIAYFGLDVTSQRRKERALRTRNDRLIALIDTLPDGILELDAEQRVLLVNDAFRELARLDLAVADPDLEWDILLTAVQPSVVDTAAVDRLRDAVDSARASASEEIAFVDGRVMRVALWPVKHDRHRGGTLVQARDVTAEVEASRGLEVRRRALAEATVTNNEFVATAAHELRGPLSSVVAFAHLLGDAGVDTFTDDQRAYLEIINRNADRLLRLIEDLLLLSRLESRTLALRLAPLRLADLLEHAVAERQAAAAAAGLTLICEVVEGPPLVCDETRVNQLVSNLLGNAAKFTPAGGRITVRAHPIPDAAGGAWGIEVTDTGVGIPQAELPHVFDAFYRGSNVAAASGLPGTGLGLVVSRAIVDLHGGTLRVDSTEGHGTTVTLSLPARPARRTENDREPTSRS